MPPKRPPKLGRPSKLDADAAEAIVSHLRRGAPITTAARAAGVNRSTFYEWLQVGREHLKRGRKTPYATFARRAEQAEAEGELLFVGALSRAVVRAAGVKNAADNTVRYPSGNETNATGVAVRAALGFLRVRWPKRYSETLKAEHTGKNGKPIETVTRHSYDLKNATDADLAQLEALARKLQKRAGAADP